MDKSHDVHEQWRLLFAYVASIQSNIAKWKSFFNTFDANIISTKKIFVWMDKIDTFMEVLKRRYAYDTLQRLNVNPYASGFPLLHDVRIIEQEYKKLRQRQSSSIVSSKDLRREFIDQIYTKQSVNYALLEKVSKASAQELLLRSEPLHMFYLIGLQEVDSVNGKKAFVCFWECWDNRCIPSLYAMLFEYSAETEWYTEMTQEVALVLREETTYMPVLARLGQHIDMAIAYVHPKWIGRITFGPIFVSHVTLDTIPLQQIIDRVAQNGDLVSASRVIYEYVVSSDEEIMHTLCDAKGRKHSVLQKFGIRETDDECRIREASHVGKFLFAPHTVTQLLDGAYRKEINHEII